MVAAVRHALDAARAAIVVIDDLQWADDDSLELLALLVERVARPLTIVATLDRASSGLRCARVLERLGAARRGDRGPRRCSRRARRA